MTNWLDMLTRAFAESEKVVTGKGDVLVHRWDDLGPNAYLLELYRPASRAEICELEECWGKRLPETYRNFLERHNGARLFRYFSLSGVVREVHRSAEIEGAQPVSLLDEIYLFKKNQNALFLSGWIPIGTVALVAPWQIELHYDGRVRLFTRDDQLIVKNLENFLEAVAKAFISAFSKDGTRNQSWAEIAAGVLKNVGALS